MKLYIKQQVFSWKDRFTVGDEAGNIVFEAQGELFSWGRKLHVYNNSMQEVAFIRQKLMSFMPCYYIDIQGQEVCRIVKAFTFFSNNYRIEGIPWSVEGDFLAHEYRLHDGYTTLMQMSKKWFTWGDSYELDIPNPNDALHCLCIALAIDCAMADSQAAASSN